MFMNAGFKNIAKKIAFFVIFGLFFYRQCQQDKPEVQYKIFLDWRYNGVLVNKYLDSNNHMYPIASFVPLDSGLSPKVHLDYRSQAWGLDDIFDYIQPGDTLVKITGDSVVRVSNGDNRGRFFVGRPHDW
jgi:hypothetical protein